MLGVFVLWRISNSPFGLALNGVRDSAKRMAALGYPVYWLRVILFVIAGLYAGIGGGYQCVRNRDNNAHYDPNEPDYFDFVDGYPRWF